MKTKHFENPDLGILSRMIDEWTEKLEKRGGERHQQVALTHNTQKHCYVALVTYWEPQAKPEPRDLNLHETGNR